MTLLAPSIAVMQVTWDFNTATLSFVAVNIVIGLWSLFKTSAKANSAYELAEKASKRVEELHQSVMLTTANISLLREKVAGEYPNHEAIEAMEQRLIAEIHRLSDRLDQILDRRPSRS